MSALPTLRQVIDEFGLNARKSLGQHFLLDLNITRKIARVGAISLQDCVIEVGPGPGGLTRALLEAGAYVLAIERDARCIDALSSLVEFYPSKFMIVEENALKAKEVNLLKTHGLSPPYKLVSNLPYNISTELLIKWLKVSPTWWESLTLMFQKEVADRILAAPGSKSYGRLSVISQAISEVRKGFDLPARAFTPPPKVNSTVLHFVPHAALDFDKQQLERLTAAAFSQRRKMVRSSLKSVFGENVEGILSQFGLSGELRAEQISVRQYIDLSKVLP